MGYYASVTKMNAKDEKLDDLAGILISAAELLETNTSCIAYIVSKDLNEQFLLVNELWKDKESHDASLSNEFVKELIVSATPLLSTPPEIIAKSSIIGGKGVPSK